MAQLTVLPGTDWADIFTASPGETRKESMTEWNKPRPRVGNVGSHVLGAAREIAGDVMTDRVSRPVNGDGEPIQSAETFDPFAAIECGVDTAFGAGRAPVGLQARLRHAANEQAAEAATPLTEKVAPEVRDDVQKQLDYIEFLDELQSSGQMTDSQYIASREEAEAELAKMTGRN